VRAFKKGYEWMKVWWITPIANNLSDSGFDKWCTIPWVTVDWLLVHAITAAATILIMFFIVPAL
jgi:hypothetical protein